MSGHGFSRAEMVQKICMGFGPCGIGSETVKLPRKSTTPWRLRTRTLDLGRSTLVMGVVNITPDSFSDGGAFLDPEAAVARA